MPDERPRREAISHPAGYAVRSPRLPDAIARPQEPSGLTLQVIGDDQLHALVAMAHETGATRIALGSGRDQGSQRSAAKIRRAWHARGGTTVAQVDWPEQAASWLRQARSLTAPDPDMWLLGGPAPGLAQVVRRLARDTLWQPERTLGFGPTTAEAVLLAGYGLPPGHALLDGMRGSDDLGRRWQVINARVRIAER